MKRLALSVLLGAALFTTMADTAAASWWDRQPIKIRVQGKEYQGKWAFVGERPYVNVESFGRALGLPRRHNVKNWNLGTDGAAVGSPFQLVVDSGQVKLPTTRFGGATYVDVQAACEALGIPFHRDWDGEYIEVGDAYQGEYMIGAWERWVNNKGANYTGGTHRGARENDRLHRSHYHPGQPEE